MKKLIIKVLEENRMYDDNYDGVLINKAEEFFRTYHFNNTNENPIIKDAKRNKDGLLNFSNLPYIISDLKSDGHNEAFWILLANGSRIMCKKVEQDEICMELLVSEFLEKIKMPHALYDVMSLNGKTYLISQSFLSPNEYLYNYYYTDDTFLDISAVLSKASEINQEFYMMKTMLIDLLIDNKDRFPHNAKVIMDGSTAKPCPLFDNGIACLTEKYKEFYVIPSLMANTDFDNIISYLFSNNKLLKWFLLNVQNVDFLGLNKLIREKKNGLYVDEEVNDLLMTTLDKNLRKANNIVKNL